MKPSRLRTFTLGPTIQKKAGGRSLLNGAQQERATHAPKLSNTYNDVFEVLMVCLLVNPRIHDLGLLRLQSLDLLLGKVWDVPVLLLLRVMPLKVLVLRS